MHYTFLIPQGTLSSLLPDGKGIKAPSSVLCRLYTQTVPWSAFMLLANELQRDVVMQVSVSRDVYRDLTAMSERHCVKYKHLFEER